MSDIQLEYQYIAIDFQKDFTDEKGLWFIKGNSVDFIKYTLTPFFLENHIKVFEIISDYRLPRNGRKGNGCDPDTFGFESDISPSIKQGKPWIKCMHNPIWTRNNAGAKGVIPGKPYQKPELFDNWLHETIGYPVESKRIILFGETMEICVLATAQELYYRGYNVSMLYEATDPMNERLSEKVFLSQKSSIPVYANIMHFDQLVNIYKRNGAKLII